MVPKEKLDGRLDVIKQDFKDIGITWEETEARWCQYVDQYIHLDAG